MDMTTTLVGFVPDSVFKLALVVMGLILVPTMYHQFLSAAQRLMGV